jgi:hypothetical protein
MSRFWIMRQTKTLPFSPLASMHRSCGTSLANTYSIISCAQHSTVAGDCDRSHRHIVLGNELVAAFVLAQVPHTHCAGAVAAYQLALIGVYHHVIDGAAVVIVSLHAAAASVPDLDCAVFGRCHHPLSLAVKGDAGDITGVALKSQHGGRIGGLDVVELDRVVASGGEVALVG